MQKDIQSQITELTLQQKSELEHLHRHTGSKIEYVFFPPSAWFLLIFFREMKAQNKAIIREYDALSMKIKQLSEEEELLSKTLRKYVFNIATFHFLSSNASHKKRGLSPSLPFTNLKKNTYFD